MRTRSGGFTIIELLAVLVLSALLAGLVTVSMVGRGRAVRIDDAVGQVIAYERAARDHARSGGLAELVYDTRRREIRLEGDALLQPPPPLKLAGGFGVVEVRQSGQRGNSVLINADGRSQTYAVKLGNKNANRWLLFVGLTGRPLELDNERFVQDILKTAATGDDAR